MNTNYIHIDNKAIISDENGNKKVIPYYDNLYDVLTKENIIEKFEKELKKTIDRSNELKKSGKHYFPIFVPEVLLLIHVGIPILFKYIDKNNTGMLTDPLYGSLTLVNILQIYLDIPCLTLATLIDILHYSDFMSIRKEKNGNEVKIEYLKKELNLIKEELKGLNSNKTNSSIQKDGEWNETNLENNPFVKDYVNQIINIYYKLGYDEKKLYKYYLQGKLNKVFEGNNLNLATKYFEEKGNVLSKKYNIKKK